jgi:hypothetical protein
VLIGGSTPRLPETARPDGVPPSTPDQHERIVRRHPPHHRRTRRLATPAQRLTADPQAVRPGRPRPSARLPRKHRCHPRRRLTGPGASPSGRSARLLPFAMFTGERQLEVTSCLDHAPAAALAVHCGHCVGSLLEGAQLVRYGVAQQTFELGMVSLSQPPHRRFGMLSPQ